MGNSVNAVIDGFDYQAYWFWWKACELLRRQADVVRVGFEVNQYTAFDDVAVEYARPWGDGGEDRYTAAYFSIKYSVDYRKELSAASLGDPSLINAEKISLLERLRDAVEQMKAAGKSHVFVLMAPWGFPKDDPIRKLIETSNGSIRYDVLYDGTSKKGVMGALRHDWTKLLGLKDEKELWPILSRLRIELDTRTASAHREHLSVQLPAVGLVPIQKSDLVVPYFQMPYKMRKASAWFDAAAIRAACAEQNLIGAVEKPARNATRLGLRSFMRLAEGLGDEVDQLLCVVDEFNGRTPRTGDVWSDRVPAALHGFFQKHLKRQGQFDLHLHCFGSMAFLAGYLNDPGLGVSAGIVQRPYGRPAETWTVDTEAVKKEAAGWKTAVEKIGDGAEYAVAINLTHDTKAKVLQHCRESLPAVGHVLVASPVGGPSFAAASSGTHAFALAEQLKNEVVNQCAARKGKLHLFWAAPNAFAYYFGQVSRPLGACRLYEFDMAEQTYTTSLDVSPKLRLENVN